MNAVSYLDVGWHPGTVLLSVLVAAGMAMAVAAHRQVDRQVDRRLHLVASLVMTAGIVSMHYLGMAAIDLQPGIDWDWPRWWGPRC